MRKLILLATCIFAMVSASAEAPACAPCKALPAPASMGTSDADFLEAFELVRAGQHAAAYGRLARLADAGHVSSARLALIMQEQGRRLFGSQWYATPVQLARWRQLACAECGHCQEAEYAPE